MSNKLDRLIAKKESLLEMVAQCEAAIAEVAEKVAEPVVKKSRKKAE